MYCLLKQKITNRISPISQLSSPSQKEYDLIFQLYCDEPKTKTEHNKGLMLLGWPATLSILAAPLGIAVLSLPGIVHDTTSFTWHIRLIDPSAPFGEDLIAQKSLPNIQAQTSGSAWGIPDDVKMQSYCNVDTHIIRNAVEYAQKTDWRSRYLLSRTSNPLQPDEPFDDGLDTSDPIKQRWAVIIGISKYKDPRIQSLQYADADARAFYQWTVNPNGAGYPTDHVRLLTNAEATTQNIKNALMEWLQHKAIAEDLVTIYIASHGSPGSSAALNNLYLLTYDTDFDHIDTTAFPMWDISTALQRYIKAERVVIFADTCHSGGIGADFKVAMRDNENFRSIVIQQMNSQLETLTENTISAHKSRAVTVFTSTQSDQLSREGLKWGGGHGVYTYFLLKGLEGDADSNSDRNVTVAELTEYVSECVRRDTGNAQTPVVYGTIAKNLVLNYR